LCGLVLLIFKCRQQLLNGHVRRGVANYGLNRSNLLNGVNITGKTGPG
jgi:hypothetical protein